MGPKEDTSPRLTKKFIEGQKGSGRKLYSFFKEMESKGWPVTLHSDLGKLWDTKHNLLKYSPLKAG